MAALLGVGVVMVYNVSYFYAENRLHDSSYFFRRHVASIILGTLACLTTSYIPSKYYRKAVPTLPASLQAALRHGRALRIELATAQRLAALRTRLDPSVLDAARVLESLRHVLPEGARPKAVAWGERLATGTSSHETAAVMVDYMDHLYRELAPPESVRECCLALASLSDEAVRAGLAMLPPPWQNDLNVDPDQINP